MVSSRESYTDQLIHQDLHLPLPLPIFCPRYKVSVKTDSIRKLSHLNFQWEKACTKIISLPSILHSFLNFSRAIKKNNVQSYIK